jgi:hypothetical protein
MEFLFWYCPRVVFCGIVGIEVYKGRNSGQIVILGNVIDYKKDAFHNIPTGTACTDEEIGRTI